MAVNVTSSNCSMLGIHVFGIVPLANMVCMYIYLHRVSMSHVILA